MLLSSLAAAISRDEGSLFDSLEKIFVSRHGQVERIVHQYTVNLNSNFKEIESFVFSLGQTNICGCTYLSYIITSQFMTISIYGCKVVETLIAAR